MKIIGLACKTAEIRGVVCNISGTILNTARLAANIKNGKLKYISKVQSLINILAQCHCCINSVGVVFIGNVDAKSGLVLSAPDEMKKYVGTDLFAVAGAVTDANVVVENEARASLIGEHWLGAAKNYKNVVMLTLDNYIDTAIMVDGQMCVSKQDFSKMQVTDENGEVRALNDYISAKAMSQKMEKALGRNACREEYLEEFLSGNKNIYNTLLDFSKYLTKAICKIKDTYNPEAIIIGGEFSEWYPNFIPFVTEQMEKHKINVAVEKAKFGPDSACIGAVYLCRENT